MGLVARWFFPAAGILVAVFAGVVSVRAWLGERSFAEGGSAQRAGDFNAADAAYRVAGGRGNADAATERARLKMIRRDWGGADEALREVMTLAPTRAYPYILLARLDVNRPGPWDDAREERVLGACRSAVSLEPAQGATWGESAGVLLTLVSLRRAHWDPTRIRTVITEATDGFAEALARDPGAARDLFVRMLAEGGDPVFLLEVAARRSTAANFSTLVSLLLDRALWTEAEPGLWAAAEAFGVLPTYATAAADVLARRAMIQEALAATRRGLLAAPRDGTLSSRAADFAARLAVAGAQRPSTAGGRR